LNIYIYRDAANNPASSILEEEAREYVCRVNAIYRDAGTAIQFYSNRVEFESNNFYNQQVSTNLHVYDLWSRKRYISDNSKGINVHFIRYNNAPEDSPGKASLPHYAVPPYGNYSLYVRTHNITSDRDQRDAADIAATLAHEIGHTLSLLHTHHPGRYASLALNSGEGEGNGTISNGCHQESVSRVKKNYWYNGCPTTDNKLKCEVNGDFLCDTPADPRQTGRVNADCIYNTPASGDFRSDNWGDLWTPPTNNVMAYTQLDCRNQFSRNQTGIMWMQMPALKTYINYQQPVIASLGSCASPRFTLGGTLPNDATITWQAEPARFFNVASGSGTAVTLN
jgi:hypothetical protein